MFLLIVKQKYWGSGDAPAGPSAGGPRPHGGSWEVVSDSLFFMDAMSGIGFIFYIFFSVQELTWKYRFGRNQ